MDKVLKAIKGNVRILATFSTNTVKEMARRHETSPTATAALGRATTAAALMGSLLKQNQKTSLVINGGGPAGTLMAESDNLGNVRSFISNPSADIDFREDGKLNVGGLVGKNGELKVIKDLNLKEPFTGYVPLQNGEIALDLTYYLAVSEQTPSVVSLGVSVNKTEIVQSAAGLIIQMLPGHTEEELKWVEELLPTLPPMSDVANAYAKVEHFLSEYIADAKVVGEWEYKFNCTCSIDKMKDAIALVPNEEFEDIIKKEGKVEVKCNFCNLKYSFDKDLNIIK